MNGHQKPKHECGLTLIEVLVVVALIGLMSFLMLPSISGIFKLSIDTAAREIASTVKEAYNQTAITGRTHRIAFDIKERTYWVESGSPTALLHTKESLEKEKQRRRGLKEEEQKQALDADNEFRLEPKVTKKPLELPQGVEYVDIISESQTEPISQGTAYAHLFPHGLTERTILHIKDNSKHQITIILAPLMGVSEVRQGYIREEEAYPKYE